MAWAQNLLGFCLFACASQTPFSWVWPGGFAGFQVLRCAKVCLAWGDFFSLFLVGSKSNVSAVFWLRFRMVWALYFFLFSGFQKRRFGIFPGCGFAMAWAQNLLGFCLFACASQTPFSWVWSGGLQASKSDVAQRFALLEATFFLFLVGSKCNVSAFLFYNGFQQRRFGIFPAAVSQWLGHKTCWGSAFSHARPKHLFLEFGLVACRLPSLTLRKGLPCLRQPFFLFLVGSESNFLCF